MSEVIVTGSRRPTPLSTTPVAINAVHGSSLVHSATEDLAQLYRLAPGLTPVESGPSNLRLVIRGVQAVGEPTVGLYYDETPVTGSVGAANDAGGSAPQLKLFDVERVEVLRGPQGTLFGASAMTGAVRVLFRKPSMGYAGLASLSGVVTEGGTTGYTAQGVVNVPLVDDLLAARLVLFDEQRPGYVDNVFLRRDDVDRERARGGRLTLRLTPSRRVTIDAAGYYQRTTGQLRQWSLDLGPYRSNAQTELPNQESFKLVSLTPRLDLGAVEVISSLSYATRDLAQANADASYFFASLLGNPAACGRLNGGACSAEQLAAFDERVQSVIPGVVHWGQTTDTSTAELRAASKSSGRLQWTVGGFFSQRRAKARISEMPADPRSGELLEPMHPQFLRLVHDTLNQWAMFAEASVHVTQRFALTAGARGFLYEREVGGEIPVPLDLLGAQLTPFSATSLTEKGAVPKLAASYELTADHFVYAQVSEGFRPGGINQINGLPAALAPYKADRAWSYELGTKTNWLSRRLSLNANGYLMTWNDMQVTGSRPDGLFRFISNAGAARILGLELDISAQPVSGLRIEANGTMIDARLSEDQVNGTVVAPGRKGDRIPYVPRLAAGLSAQYVKPLSASFSGLGRIDANYVGSSHSELRPDNPFQRRIDAYGLVSVRVGLQSSTSGWAGYVFVSNALGATAVHYASTNAVTAGRTIAASASPRTWGLNLRKSF